MAGRRVYESTVLMVGGGARAWKSNLWGIGQKKEMKVERAKGELVVLFSRRLKQKGKRMPLPASTHQRTQEESAVSPAR